MTDRISKFTWLLVHVLCHRSLTTQTPRARARTRPRERPVRSFVLSTMENSPCWPGNQSESLAVTDRSSKLTWLLVHVLCRRSLTSQTPRARARPRERPVRSSVFSTMEKSPCWPERSREPFALTDRMPKFTWLLVHVLCHRSLTTQTPRARARARARACAPVSDPCGVPYCPQWKSRHVGVEILDASRIPTSPSRNDAQAS